MRLPAGAVSAEGESATTARLVTGHKPSGFCQACEGVDVADVLAALERGGVQRIEKAHLRRRAALFPCKEQQSMRAPRAANHAVAGAAKISAKDLGREGRPTYKSMPTSAPRACRTRCTVSHRCSPSRALIYGCLGWLAPSGIWGLSIYGRCSSSKVVPGRRCIARLISFEAT